MYFKQFSSRYLKASGTPYMAYQVGHIFKNIYKCMYRKNAAVELNNVYRFRGKSNILMNDSTQINGERQAQTVRQIDR